jgi:molecular chaperone DnaJ
MATQRDYYDVLGVPRGASAEEIKRAYRGLARKLHPDVAGADEETGEEFRAVNEAYEVLSDAERRASYDRYGRDGAPPLGGFGDIFNAFFGEEFGGRGGRRRGPQQGADAVVDLQVTLAEAAFGVVRDVDVDVIARCSHCEGSGAEPPAGTHQCDTCGGVGQVQQVQRTMLGSIARTATCPTCHGRGTVPDDPCTVCHGRGRLSERRVISIPVPAGVDNGHQIVLRGQGHGGDAGAPDGDLYGRIFVLPDPRFEREGADLLTVAEITVAQAALGAKITIDTLDGDRSVTIPPGTQSDEVVTVSGLGMPLRPNVERRGNLHVLSRVVVPKRLDSEQRRLFEELDRSFGGSERGEGFLGRLFHKDG